MRFDLDALPQIGQETTSDGTPPMLHVEAIDEDPKQPRCEFDPEPLQQLAASIAQRGVLQAISVRRHPDQPDRWMLNFGARRLRASKLAGLTQIPAYVNETATSYDQVIENEHREGLKPLELALFVQSRLSLGESQAEIARRMGKSRQYVTMATALIDAPDWLISAYREGRCRGLNELYELRKLAGDHPQYVESWTADRDAITRDRVTALRADLADGSANVRRGTSALIQAVAERGAQRHEPEASAPSPEQMTPSSRRRASPKLRLLAGLDGTDVVVDTQSAPPEAGQVFVRAVGGGTAEAVDAARLTLRGLVSE